MFLWHLGAHPTPADRHEGVRQRLLAIVARGRREARKRAG
jgi:hypothetical protein